MNTTTLFFENFFKILGLPFQTIASGESSVVTWGTSTSLTAGQSFTDGIRNFTEKEGDAISGTSSMVSATATVLTYLQTYNPEYVDINLTQSYIESLSEDELQELVVALDEKGNELEISEEQIVLKRTNKETI